MATPFLKWAGGKRWFTSRYLDILPQKYNRYIEPFVGSGALFFALEPQEAVIGDINKPLVETYMAIKDDWKLVLEYLRTHSTQHSKEYYYSVPPRSGPATRPPPSIAPTSSTEAPSATLPRP